MDKLNASSTFIQDGDVHNDIFTKYQYGGELFGDFDYLSQRACRNMFLNKINSQCIEVTIHSPMLGLIKGDHVNLWWYDIANKTAENLDTSSITSNTAIPDDTDNKLGDEVSAIINKTISGQYYIVDVEFNYLGDMVWNNKYILSRSAEDIQRINPPSNETFMK